MFRQCASFGIAKLWSVVDERVPLPKNQRFYLERNLPPNMSDDDTDRAQLRIAIFRGKAVRLRLRFKLGCGKIG